MPDFTMLDIKHLVTEKKMKPGKKKWHYRCHHCKNVYDSESHGNYTLINTFDLDYYANICIESIHEGTMFCTINCAIGYLKDNDINLTATIQTIKNKKHQ